MGTSTDGLLWFGVAFTDGEDELAETISRIMNGDEDDNEEGDWLYGDGREWLAEKGLTGVEFVDHCSGEYPMYGLAVAGTLTRARRGYPERITMDSPDPDPAPVLAALAALGVEPDDVKVGWHLASMWG